MKPGDRVQAKGPIWWQTGPYRVDVAQGERGEVVRLSGSAVLVAWDLQAKTTWCAADELEPEGT